MNKETLINRILNRLEKSKSAWKRGVLQYAVELINDVDLTDVCNQKLLEKAILNGAENWNQYSEGGCAFCYNSEICDRLCPPSVVKRKDHGRLPPNSRESWIDVQARALKQAERIIKQEAKNLYEIDSQRVKNRLFDILKPEYQTENESESDSCIKIPTHLKKCDFIIFHGKKV